MNVIENMSVKMEDTCSSSVDVALSITNPHSTEASQVASRSSSECEALTSVNKEGDQREIKTERDVAWLIPSAEDVPLSLVPALSDSLLPLDVPQFEGAQFIAELVPFATSSRVAEIDQIMSKEEDLCLDEDVFEAMIESHIGNLTDNHSDCKRDGESSQILTACDQVSESPAGGLGLPVCSSSPNAESDNVRHKSKQLSAPLQKPFTHHNSSRSNIRDVRVVLVDIFPGNSRESSKHIDSKSCVCVLCVGKFRFSEKQGNFEKGGIGRKSDQLNAPPGKCCGKLKSGKWFLCDACPARFIFAHSLRRHFVMDHRAHLCLVCHVMFERDSDLRAHNEMHTGKKQYLCVFCQFESETEADLEVHLKSHPHKKRFSCAKCKETFETSYSLSSHVLKHTNKAYKGSVPSESKRKCQEYSPIKSDEKTMLCPYCPAKFKIRCRFKEHLMRHTNEGPYACSQCPSRFVTPSILRQHMVRHSSETPFACTFCPAKFKRDLALKNHLMIHNNIKPFACKYCDAKFRENAHLRFHTRIHLDEKPYPCTQCDRKCRTVSALKSHLKTHSGEKPFACGECSRRFRSRYCFRVHLASHTKDAKPLVCPHCPARFSLEKRLRVHLMTHTGEKPSECVHCSRRFKEKGELRKHIVIHFPEKPFLCDECDGAFRHRRQLSAHKLTHSDVKPYACEVCHATFKLRSVLNLHRKSLSHFVGIVFTCEHCPVKFKTKKEIRLHMFTHAERKRHFCRHCSASFPFKCRLEDHLKVKHSSKRPFACPHCLSKFKLKEHLNYHLKRHSSGREQVKESSTTQIKEEI